jgi:hypothetical protein
MYGATRVGNGAARFHGLLPEPTGVRIAEDDGPLDVDALVVFRRAAVPDINQPGDESFLRRRERVDAE